MPSSWQSEVDLILLFSLVPGGILLLLLSFDALVYFSAVLALGFLCFYPGYLFVRRININGLLFRVLLSVGLSVALITPFALIALGLGRWHPAYQTALIVLIVFTDVIFGKGSIISYLFPVLDLSSIWLVAQTELMAGIRSRVGVRSKHQDDLGREIIPEPNFLWQIEFVKVNSLMLQKEVEMVVISDLITQECLAAIHYRTGFSKHLTDQFSWLFFNQSAPKYIELHHFGDFDTEKITGWLRQNYSATVIVPKSQHYEAYLRHQMADFVNRRISPNADLNQQLDQWKYNYNQSLRITLPSKHAVLEAL